MTYKPILIFAGLCWVLIQMHTHLLLASLAFILLPVVCVCLIPVILLLGLLRHTFRRRATFMDTLIRKRVP